MKYQLKWVSLILGIAMIIGGLSACDQRNPAVLQQHTWQLTTVTGRVHTIGRATFTAAELTIDATNQQRQTWHYYFNRDDDLVITAGAYNGTYVLKNEAADYLLVPIQGAQQQLKLRRVK
ncbi:hypothetical protein C5Z26_07050 [Lactobacillus sp. CBA3606]|uniref:hypothetical protein n=1 Tax=Lactobacillus sp. CBA3606 TaxID=2099789 RepID=UPI000CFCB532|nr:hypothetical protein [Lactobacillus sp. CBA3606]AVK63878.1 hypothetical protein C5Z26_07050 [Lactobacillus sp. CBA3606]